MTYQNKSFEERLAARNARVEAERPPAPPADAFEPRRRSGISWISVAVGCVWGYLICATFLTHYFFDDIPFTYLKSWITRFPDRTILERALLLYLLPFPLLIGMRLIFQDFRVIFRSVLFGVFTSLVIEAIIFLTWLETVR